MNMPILSSSKAWVQRNWPRFLAAFNLWIKRGGYFVVGAILALLLIPVVVYVTMSISFYGRVFPGVSVAHQVVSGMGQEQAKKVLTERVSAYTTKEWPLIYTHKQEELLVSLDGLEPSWDTASTADEALLVGRSGPVWERALERFTLLREGVELPLQVSFDADKAASLSATLAEAVNEPAVPTTVELLEYADRDTGSRIVVHKGATGKKLQEKVWLEEVEQSLSYLTSIDTTLPIETVGKAVSDDQITQVQERAEKLLNKELALSFGENGGEQTWTLEESDLIAFLRVEGGYAREAVETYVQGVAESINRPAQDAKFVFNESTSKVEEFKAALPGLKVDVQETAERMIRALHTLENADATDPVLVQVSKTDPEVTLDSVNDLGIEELIGRGESTYFGSILSRVHNVALAAERINGTLIKPGETFSFNNAVGEISANTGYQSAYVIRNGRTELGDGGGVCQDSTTVFRAALDAGLPIVERRAHSYRVGYYEQNAKPGLDATVFSPTTDLVFKNDTPGHILIQAKADTPNRHLVVEIYGTSDGRVSTVTEPVVWDVAPPPPDKYQDDPTLPEGLVKQVDWKAWGAKSKFDYVVERDGETLIEKTFYSTYKPWAAVFLRGVGPSQE